MSKVTSLTDSQLAHHLIRQCLDACRVNHLLRAVDTYVEDSGVRDVDGLLLDAFADVVGYPLTATAKVQVGLPLSVGGCGLKCPLSMRPAARLAALCSFYSEGAERIGLPVYAQQIKAHWLLPPLQEMSSILGPNFDPLPRWLGHLEHIRSADALHTKQHWWAASLGQRCLDQLLDSASPRDQARLLEQMGPGLGSSFMSVTPSSPLHTTFSPDTYRVGLRWWLGLPLLKENQASVVLCPGCQAQVDVFGDHLLCCLRNNYSRRHNAVQEAIASVAQEAGQPFSREEVIPGCPDSQLRPADLLFKAWQTGLDVAVDLTVVHGWQQSEQATTATVTTRERWRNFLTKKERHKKDKYANHCSAAGWAFSPMAFGTWGGMGPEAAKLLHRLVGRAASWLEGPLRARRQHELRESVGVALMRHIWLLLDAKNLLQ